MTGQVRRRLNARLDLISIARHYSREANQITAERFLDVAEATFRRLASAPGTGARLDLDEPALADLRYSPLPTRFKKYVVIYRPMPDGIEVVRILHGARDLGSILATEADDEPDQ